jgi:hypothetical protein
MSVMGNIVGFAGQMQNGKDTAADYMFEKIKSKWADVERASFADNVKRIFCETFNVDRSFVEEWKTKSEVPEGFDSPVRQGLQQIGDGFRKIQGKIWIELAFRNRVRSAIFSDVRYINELKKIKEVGGTTVLVWRPGHENEDPNGSEAQIKPLVDWFASQPCSSRQHLPPPEGVEYVDHFLVNDGSVEDLCDKVDDIILSL